MWTEAEDCLVYTRHWGRNSSDSICSGLDQFPRKNRKIDESVMENFSIDFTHTYGMGS